MTTQERIANWKVHPSQRGHFAFALYKEMAVNDSIYCLTGDLGFAMLDNIRDDFPDRFINCGAAECGMVGAAVGLSLSGRIPFCYSISPFLLYRPFEWLRNYVNHERIPVRLVGSGWSRDYAHDGITHHAHDAEALLQLLPEIRTYFPIDLEQIPYLVHSMIELDKPSFLCLRR